MKAFTQKSDEFDQLNPLRTTAHQSTILRTLRLLLCRTACALLALTTMSLATSVYAQNCNALVPGGGDDAVQINNCLATVGHATLTANTFLINQPIAWPQVSNVSLTGAGKNATHIVPQYSCGQSSAFVVNGTFQNIIWVLKAPSATLRDFHLDLSNLRQSCGNAPNMAVRIDKSPSSQVRSLKISGSQYGDPGYTSGWANGGGINVVNSANCVIDNNAIRELGFIDGAFEGLRIEASGSTLVNSNVVFHVSFALVISNGTVAQGYTGDSSFSTITSNIFTGAAGINCPGCHSGRSIKMIACAFDPIPPMRYLTVTNNTGSNWGGPDQAGVSPSGIDLHCGVQYSTFTGNNFVGGPQSSYGLEIRSSFMSNQVASHHNVFNNNTFAAGPCSGCFDVFFTGDGPDQSSGTISSVPSIGRAVHGSNSFSTFLISPGPRLFAVRTRILGLPCRSDLYQPRAASKCSCGRSTARFQPHSIHL